MKLNKLIASITIAALMLCLPGGSALAAEQGATVRRQFADMAGYEWGLSHVAKMSALGIMKGQGPGIFAPGAKITFQETAVATVRLIGKEGEAQALSEAEVSAHLAGIPDQAGIASWARAAVAMLVRAGAVSPTAAFNPTSHASRLDVTVMLVKALGYEAEAQAKVSAALGFKDSHQIPAGLTGYVAVAAEKKLITGYEDQTFRPMQAVKRVEMAVIAGRADSYVGSYRADVVKGTVNAVDAAGGSLSLWAKGVSLQIETAADAAVFVNGEEKAFSDIEVGMVVQIKLDAPGGKAIFIEARSPQAGDDAAPVTVSGTITNLKEATAEAEARVSVGVTTGGITVGSVYRLDDDASFTINGRAATFADLAVGDAAELVVDGGVAIAVKVTRPVTTVEGKIAILAAATAESDAKMTIISPDGDAFVNLEYWVVSDATVKVNSEDAAVTDLRIGDEVTLTVLSSLVLAVEAERDVVISGSISALAGATDDTPASISAAYNVDGTGVVRTFEIGEETAILINGQPVHFAALQLGDSVQLTTRGETLLKVEVTR